MLPLLSYTFWPPPPITIDQIVNTSEKYLHNICQCRPIIRAGGAERHLQYARHITADYTVDRRICVGSRLALLMRGFLAYRHLRARLTDLRGDSYWDGVLEADAAPVKCRRSQY